MRTAEDTKENQEKFSKYRKSFADQIQRLVAEGQAVQDPSLIEECKILLELAKEDQVSLDDKLTDVTVLEHQLKNGTANQIQQQPPVTVEAQTNETNVTNNKRKADDAQLNDDEKVAKKSKTSNSVQTTNHNPVASTNKRVTRSQSKAETNTPETSATNKNCAKKSGGKKKKVPDNEADMCCVCMDEKRCVMFEPCKYVQLLETYHNNNNY